MIDGRLVVDDPARHRGKGLGDLDCILPFDGVAALPATFAWADEAPPAAAETPNRVAKAGRRRRASIARLTERVRKSVVVITSAGRDRSARGARLGLRRLERRTDRHQLSTSSAKAAACACNWPTDGSSTPRRFMPRTGRSTWPCCRSTPRTCRASGAGRLRRAEARTSRGGPGQSARADRTASSPGVVSGVREMEGRPMIQLAIPIEPGNSGGPLVDMQGRVQGVLTMKSLVTPNLGFALTVEPAQAAVGQAESDSDVALADDRRARPARMEAAVRRPLAAAGRPHHGRRHRARALAAARCACAEPHVPELPFEMAVTVHLNDESGAAGLAFCSDGERSPLWFLSAATAACG